MANPLKSSKIKTLNRAKCVLEQSPKKHHYHSSYQTATAEFF